MTSYKKPSDYAPELIEDMVQSRKFKDILANYVRTKLAYPMSQREEESMLQEIELLFEIMKEARR